MSAATNEPAAGSRFTCLFDRTDRPGTASTFSGQKRIKWFDPQSEKKRVRLFPKIANFAVFVLLPLTVSATTFAAERPHIRYYKSFKGPDRTITWQAWKEVPGGAFRWRTGDRYLGGERWEHYLCFEQHPGQANAIKLSMIHLASESVEDVLLRPGLR